MAEGCVYLCSRRTYNRQIRVISGIHQFDGGTSMLKARAILMLCVSLIACAPVTAQDPDINARIRKEETDNSQIMRTMHFLTDVYGPRLTGSPSLKAAGDWA